MHNKLLIPVLVLSLLTAPLSYADPLPDEGMWLPMFIKRLNYQDMRKMGLKLKPEEIYDVNNSSLKDAIVMLRQDGRMFCTAEAVSKQGLLFTNHHCAYGMIQEHSTVENNYLKNGFWAMSKEEELPNPGYEAAFLVRMDDVTQKVLEEVKGITDESERSQKVAEISASIEREASENGKYEARVSGFFEGNEYYLFVYKVYRDLRLVGAPGEDIGKFGGDTDNWMWPRHTGDFAMLRIYGDGEGEPAEYADSNKPITPKHHLPVSMGGVAKEDFAMIMGFPGSTDRYLPSEGVKLAIEESHPTRIEIRDAKLKTMKKYMDADPAVRLQYASKYAQVSNYWKYFIGQVRGLKRLNVVEKKQKLEEEVMAWVNKDSERKAKYGDAMDDIERGYEMIRGSNKAYYTFVEAGYLGAEILQFSWNFAPLLNMLKGGETEGMDDMIADLKTKAEEHFKDYNKDIDQEMFAVTMKLYYSGVNPEFHPLFFENIRSEYNIDFQRYATTLFTKSLFSDKASVMEFLDNPDAETLENDMALSNMREIMGVYIATIQGKRSEAEQYITRGKRKFIAALREMKPDKKFAPDANRTLRLTYGQVLDYFPADGVYYNYYTTADGILQKEDPTDPEFNVPQRMKELLKAKDYGRYGTDGKLMVGFLTNTDITGGNSGSPVMNGKGELIGIAFDGNWEAMSGDIAFEHELQRTISVDIRYVLWTIDKLYGAGHLVNEMTIVNEGRQKSAKHKVIIGG